MLIKFYGSLEEGDITSSSLSEKTLWKTAGTQGDWKIWTHEQECNLTAPGKEPGEQVGKIRTWEGHFKGYYKTQSGVRIWVSVDDFKIIIGHLYLLDPLPSL